MSWRAAAGVLLLLCLGAAALPGAAQARVVTPVSIGSNHAGTISASLSVTTSQAVPAGGTIVVSDHDQSSVGSRPLGVSCSDSAGDGYSLDLTEGSAEHLTSICSSRAIASQLPAGATITVTWSGGSGSQDELVQAYSVGGVAASPPDQGVAAEGSSGTPSSGATAVTAQAKELLFASIVDENYPVPTAGFSAGTNGSANSCEATGTSTFSSLGGIDEGGSSPSLFGMYCVVSATGTYSASGTLSTALGPPFWVALLGTYKLAVATSGTGLGSSSNPSAPGAPVRFTAPVTGDAPTGTVAFEDGGTAISGCGAQPLNSGGVATCTTSSLSAGSHSISAVYGGDDTDTPSISSTLTQTVADAPTASITTPANGATYAQGQVVDSRFGCTEGAGGPGIRSCLDQNGNTSGTAIDTSTAGQHTVTVTARSQDGLTGQPSVTYTVSARRPAAVTRAATKITPTSATLSGTVNPNGSATTYYFQYGTASAYGRQTSSHSASANTTTHPVSASISGLASGTTYHYRIVAVNAAGTSDGADQTFTTPARPLKLSVSQAHTRPGIRACFAFKTTSTTHPVAGAIVRFAHHTARTSHAGRVTICVHLGRGSYHPTATKTGYRPAHATVTAGATPKPSFTG